MAELGAQQPGRHRGGAASRRAIAEKAADLIRITA
jgi:hypothetical protein